MSHHTNVHMKKEVVYVRDMVVLSYDPCSDMKGRRGCVQTVRFLNNRTLLMYGVAGERRPIFVESDTFLYSLGDPTIWTYHQRPTLLIK